MSLPLTPHMLAAAYDFLRECPPFKGWKLPEAEGIEFRVVRDPTLHGWHKCDAGNHCISVSEAGVGQTITLLKVVAHEMIHLWQYNCKLDHAHSHHNAKFRTTARVVCEIHGWDVKAFFF
jgi:hypothetical protein